MIPSRKHPRGFVPRPGVVSFGFALPLIFGAIICTAVAGDLLRGGYTTSSRSGASAPGSFTPPSVIKARQSAQDVLARTTQTLQALAAMQKAARKLAISGANNLGLNPNNPTQTLPNVPNGLNTGGLVPDSGLLSSGVANPVTTWQNATTPTQAAGANGETNVTVVQTGADAILNWNSFNIGKNTALDINQSEGGANEGTWIAFNIIRDPSGVPSQILGDINAGGQVYVINQNGIIFGGSSQVNLHTLVASSLPIDTALISNGLLNNPNDQWLFSALSQPAGTLPAFNPPVSFAPGGADGDVTVQPGAEISSPASAASVGGRVALIGPNVDNEGTISTPDGQTILAAGLQVGFAASSDPTLRGLDVYVGLVSDSANPSAGVVTNDGLLSVPSGDAYMVGKTVDQLGVIAATTSVTLNGRIDLLANYNAVTTNGEPDSTFPFLPLSTGAVLMGPDSVTQVLPDWASTKTVVGTSLALNSEVNVQGLAVHMDSGAQLFAPSATVNINVGTWSSLAPKDAFLNSGGQIYLDSGADIDVQGSWDVSAPVSQNIIAVQLLGPELEDSPLQRDGVFRGQTIYVDIRDTGVYDGEAWVGTPLADASGYVGLIQSTAGELTTAGGTVNLDAGGSVVMQPGSQLNVSGGWIDYQGGMVSTSEVITGGHIYPINEAMPDLVYQGFNLGQYTVNHLTYGISQTYTDPLIMTSEYEPSYVEGFAGGSLSITAPTVALDGQLVGLTVAGPRQLTVETDPGAYTLETNPSSLNIAPSLSSFTLTFQEQISGGATISTPTPPNIFFSSDDDLTPVAPFALDSSGNPLPLSSQREDNVILSPDLVGSDGFGKLQIVDPDGTITVPAAVSLDGQDAGSITFQGANVDLEGSITLPEGSLSFTSYDFDPLVVPPATQPPENPERGHFILGSGAYLSTAGLFVDNRYGIPTANTEPLAIAGGSVSITALDVDLQSGGLIDVSGGAVLNSSGTPSYGNGGRIFINAGQDPAISSLPGGKLVFDATLLGYSGATGGSLNVQAPAIQIGGDSTNADVLLLSPDFFSQGGFASFGMDGLGLTGADSLPPLQIAPDTTIEPVVTSLVVEPDGSDIALAHLILPVGVRPPVSLAFAASGVSNYGGNLVVTGNLVMGAGAVIRTDPEGSVTFNGQTVAILGSVYAPGGTISVTGNKSSGGGLFASDPTAITLPTVDLGPHAILSTAGTTILTPNAHGYTTGTVLPGGNITVSGNIVAEAGSVIDVSGASALLAVSPLSVGEGLNGAPAAGSPLIFSQNGTFAGYLMVPAEVDSNGGTITLKGGQDLFSDATLLGNAGGPSAEGGSLIVSSQLSDAGTIPPSSVTLVVTQDQPAIPYAAFYPAGDDALGHAVTDAHGNAITPNGYFTADSFMAGGFSNLTLVGAVQFQGPVDLHATGSLDIATGGFIFADSKVTLQAPYVMLGTPFLPPMAPSQQQNPFTLGSGPYFINPTYGSGDLTVIASLIEIGDLSLQGIGNANFIADNGGIQGDGTLDVAGNIYMRAGQVYPPTELTFNIDAYNYNVSGMTDPGTVTFAASGDQETPLSAGGDLNVYASVINQGGILRAPMGVINLGWDGAGAAPVDAITGAAVQASQTIKLSAGSITSVSAIDSLTGLPMEIPYGINPNGTNWIDPVGTDITVSGVPEKAIHISGATITEQKGATIDIRGGGDLMSYQFVSGVGGDQDILGSTSSFAIIPGYQTSYAPYAPFNPTPLTNDLNNDPGYVNGSLAIGQQVYLTAEGSLPAGLYTLLPARYALLPGAFLVTPNGSAAVVNQTQPDGSYLVSGYQTNAFQSGLTAQPLFTSFQVDSSAVVADRAQYTTYSANAFLAQGAISNEAPVPRLPRDSGQLIFNATQGLAIQGSLKAQSLSGGLGGLVDISSPDAIIIAGPGFTSSAPNTLVLNASELDSFGAASLLIGGSRQINANDATVTVATDSITVDNAGDPLTGQDIILVSNDALTVDPGAEIEASGASSNAEDVTVSGNGALLRVSSDPGALVTRTGATTASGPELAIGSPGETGPGPRITGASVTLDSSHGMYLDPSAIIQAKSVALNSGQITFELTNPGSGAPVPTLTSDLILSGDALQSLFGSAESLSLLSYSSIDIYGTGDLGSIGSSGQAVLKDLTLSAGEIRGFNGTGGNVTVAAQNILLESGAGATDPGAVAAFGGTLILNGDTVAFGANTLAIDQFAAVDLNGSGGIMANASGSFAVQGALNLTAPLITGAAGAAETISAGGALTLAAPTAAAAPSVTGGLGATLDFVGATGVTDNTAVTAHSGSISLQATTGDLTIGNLASASLDVSGQSKTFFNLTEYTSGGRIDLVADQGNISVASDATINVAAQSGGGNAGALSISDPNPASIVTLDGKLSGQGGAGGQSGSFSLDAGTLPSLGALDASLSAAGFLQSVSIEVHTGNVLVDGVATAANFSLSDDDPNGNITVSGEIDGAGTTGGAITLQAAGSVILDPTALLTVAAANDNAAGQGGSVDLEAGSDINGVASTTAVVDIQTGSTINLSVTNTNPALGDLSGTLYLRAPQTASNTDLQVNPINGTIIGASSITVEGYEIFNTASDNGSIDDQEGNVYNNGQTFAGNTGDLTSGIEGRLVAGNSALASAISSGATQLVIEPGAEIINPTGDLTLASSWDLSQFRFGPDNVAGDLTLRAAGNVVFEFINGVGGASLSDGFTGPTPVASLLPVGPSWSYRITAGADFSAANFAAVQPLTTLETANTGSVLLGSGYEKGFLSIDDDFQTIRTGAGSIDISAGQNVELLNTFATIYTAGTEAPTPVNFDSPETQDNPPEFSYDGGNVTISAQDDIEHVLASTSGNLSLDSSPEMPSNWLDRRGYVNPVTGQFGKVNGTIASTAWWIDFSNFSEGVGALGGGNVTLDAGSDITNVDAVIPTNAWMPIGTPSVFALTEYGGGDLTVRAGQDISGGVYYVERGNGLLSAGNSITTNSARSTTGSEGSDGWLPTTLFLGAGNFDVAAADNVLLGSVANPFLLPQSVFNGSYNKTYFSTFASDDAVDVSSLTGNVTLRGSGVAGSLFAWYQQEYFGSAVTSQPWLELQENNLIPFEPLFSLLPPTLRATSFSGDIDLQGSLTLSPAPDGTIDLAAADSINGLQPDGISGGNQFWDTSVINVSDADPNRIPGVASPLGVAAPQPGTSLSQLENINELFAESGSVEGNQSVIQTKEDLHAPGLLHAADQVPIHLFAESGDISGLTLYSPKFAQAIAALDITDIAFYIQNDNADDVTVISAGRDLIPYDPVSLLRQEAQTPGNELLDVALGQDDPGTSDPNAGDIQIAGPGTLEVLAGRNLTLGVGPNNTGDGTAAGITSIGNAADPYLPFPGSQVIAAAGLGEVADGLQDSSLDFQAFATTVLSSPAGATYFADLASTEDFDVPDYAAYEKLSKQQQEIVALDLFYLVLRDAGRDHNLIGSPGFGNYAAGMAAVQALLPGIYSGSINLTSKEIKTESGGDIDILDPGGQLTVGVELAGAQPVDQGILTDDGGNISIYTEGSVIVGTSRIFTLLGGNEIIWSTTGNIAAGEAAKTVQSAPPTRVIVDPQSANVDTDLSGLATGGGIGVLASVVGVAPGDVDLIAPAGIIDAGDAGIRATGNLSLAAVQILNASNIQAGGATSGVPTVTVAAPNLAGLSAASSAAGAGSAAASQQANTQNQAQAGPETADSVISVDVIGYGGGEGGDDPGG